MLSTHRSPSSLARIVSALLAIALASPPANAGLVSHWYPKSIAAKAEVLVTGEVLEVTEGGRVPRAESKWDTPLVHMAAEIRPLRSLTVRGKERVQDGGAISLSYYAIDWENCRGVANGPEFPGLSVGDIYVFPLRKASPGSKAHWQLLDEEDLGLLIPAASAAIQEIGRASTGLDLLRSELAGAFAKGGYETAFEAAQYVSDFGSVEQLKPVYQMIDKHVAGDEGRWLRIATACYCAMGVPRPKIAELLNSREHQRPLACLAADALGHVSRRGIHERLIVECMKHCKLHTWGTAVTVTLNYADHPAAVGLLTEALRQGRPEAVYVARHIIKDAEHPLLPAALDAAVRTLSTRPTPDFSCLSAACGLIRDHGSEDAFALLIGEIRRCQEVDRERYLLLWQSCAYVKHRRLIPICRILIDDRRPFSENWRFCDAATGQLQHVTGRDFGLASKQPIAERDKAVAKAKEYLEKNASASGSTNGLTEPRR